MSYYEVIERFRGYSFCRIQPRTGRTHQIRVHLASIGCPVLADKVYSGRDRLHLSDLVPGLDAEHDELLLARQARARVSSASASSAPRTGVGIRGAAAGRVPKDAGRPAASIGRGSERRRERLSMKRRFLRRKMLSHSLAVCGLVLLSAGCQRQQPVEVVEPEIQLCEQLQRLKNAGDPSADQLLAALPDVPDGPISQEDADRFKTDYFLHQDIRILSVHAVPSNRCVLITKGNVSVPTLQVTHGHPRR